MKVVNFENQNEVVFSLLFLVVMSVFLPECRLSACDHVEKQSIGGKVPVVLVL